MVQQRRRKCSEVMGLTWRFTYGCDPNHQHWFIIQVSNDSIRIEKCSNFRCLPVIFPNWCWPLFQFLSRANPNVTSAVMFCFACFPFFCYFAGERTADVNLHGCSPCLIPLSDRNTLAVSGARSLWDWSRGQISLSRSLSLQPCTARR